MIPESGRSGKPGLNGSEYYLENLIIGFYQEANGSSRTLLGFLRSDLIYTAQRMNLHVLRELGVGSSRCISQ